MVVSLFGIQDLLWFPWSLFLFCTALEWSLLLMVLAYCILSLLLVTVFCMCVTSPYWLLRSLSREVGVVMGMVLLWLHLLKVAMLVLKGLSFGY